MNNKPNFDKIKGEHPLFGPETCDPEAESSDEEACSLQEESSCESSEEDSEGDCPEARSYDFIKEGVVIKVKGYSPAERFMKFHSNDEDTET